MTTLSDWNAWAAGRESMRITVGLRETVALGRGFHDAFQSR